MFWRITRREDESRDTLAASPVPAATSCDKVITIMGLRQTGELRGDIFTICASGRFTSVVARTGCYPNSGCGSSVGYGACPFQNALSRRTVRSSSGGAVGILTMITLVLLGFPAARQHLAFDGHFVITSILIVIGTACSFLLRQAAWVEHWRSYRSASRVSSEFAAVHEVPWLGKGRNYELVHRPTDGAS